MSESTHRRGAQGLEVETGQTGSKTPEGTPVAGAAGPRLRTRRILPLVILLSGLVLFFAFGLDRYFTLEALKDHRDFLMNLVATRPLVSRLIFVVVYITTVAVSFPGATFLTLFGGFLFGWWEGGMLTIVAATVGATIIFSAARTALGPILKARAGPRLQRFEENFGRNAFNYLLFLRLVPVFPFWLVNLAPAFLGVKPRDFVLTTAIGITPASLVYTSLGNGVGAAVEQGEAIRLDILFTPTILLPLLGLAALAILPVLVRKWRLAKAGDLP